MIIVGLKAQEIIGTGYTVLSPGHW